MLNTVILQGRLTTDAKWRSFNDSMVCSFDVAHSKSHKDENGKYVNSEEPLFLRVDYWVKSSSSGLLNFLQSSLLKGCPVIVQGSLKANTWTNPDNGVKRTYYKISASNIICLGSKKEDSVRQDPPGGWPADSSYNQIPEDSDSDASADDIPF